MQKQIEIYSTPTCHFCQLAKEFFKQNNLAFSDYDVHTDMEKRKEMVDKTGQLGVPVIVLDGHKIIIGFDEEALRQELGL
jgi:glutaredoxin 3